MSKKDINKAMANIFEAGIDELINHNTEMLTSRLARGEELMYPERFQRFKIKLCSDLSEYGDDIDIALNIIAELQNGTDVDTLIKAAPTHNGYTASRIRWYVAQYGKGQEAIEYFKKSLDASKSDHNPDPYGNLDEVSKELLKRLSKESEEFERREKGKTTIAQEPKKSGN